MPLSFRPLFLYLYEQHLNSKVGNFPHSLVKDIISPAWIFPQPLRLALPTVSVSVQQKMASNKNNSRKDCFLQGSRQDAIF